MIKKRYLEMMKEILNEYSEKIDGGFIFGSSLYNENFNDVDLGVENINSQDLSKIRERFEVSNLPYKVDIVNFSKASKCFKKQIYKSKILWLIPKKK